MKHPKITFPARNDGTWTRLQVKLISILFCFMALSRLGAAEYAEGRIKLVLHENTGRFSLYYMTDIVKEQYEPLFVDRDPRTSFITIMAGDRTYRLGEASVFKFRLGGSSSRPAFIFESPFLSVTQEFSFIRTVDSSLTNGVRMYLTVENKGEQQNMVGLRFLLDTSLGEGGHAPHFMTNTRSFTSEAAIDGGSSDRWWITRNGKFGFMGNIFVGGITNPDLIHFANWKRLNDIPWKTPYVSGRNFNFLPYSINDSAVCYYFDPVPLGRGERRTLSLLLAAEDPNGFAQYNTGSGSELTRILRRSGETVPAGPASAMNPADYTREDLIILKDLTARIDEYLAAGAVSDEELMTIELVLSRIKGRHRP
ncbi:MAG: hypothetical protein LBO80_01200 [Treponema sp.]|nr:hypothetical protein [Treponema sp.]